ncbi:hypothetical protein [Photobacterium leiognathi]|uniref:hypothetical protein n=1 Tax=Photobacterium leiognathi TaxID=553611 RepID=UPI0027343A46|nr:hypothetical protein [Photobacterium leiognathi]
MSDDPNKYNCPYRTNYEIYIVIIWLFIGLISFVLPMLYQLPKEPYWIFSGFAALLSAIFGSKGIEVFVRKYRLKGYPLEFVDGNSKEMMKLYGINDKEIIANVCKKQR